MPGVPDRHAIENHADQQQEFVVQRWVGRQADEVEQDEKARYDQVGPTIGRLSQHQRQENHQDGNQHQQRGDEPGKRGEPGLSHHFCQVAAHQTQHITQQISQHDHNPDSRENNFVIHGLSLRIHNNHNTAALASGINIAMRLGSLFQRIDPIYDRFYPARLDQCLDKQ